MKTILFVILMTLSVSAHAAIKWNLILTLLSEDYGIPSVGHGGEFVYGKACHEAGEEWMKELNKIEDNPYFNSFYVCSRAA